MVTTPLVVAETGYLIDRQLGPTAEAAFYRSIANGDLLVEHLTAADWQRVAELVESYADFPLGGTDASIIAIAERLGIARVATLDRRHFQAVRPHANYDKAATRLPFGFEVADFSGYAHMVDQASASPVPGDAHAPLACTPVNYAG